MRRARLKGEQILAAILPWAEPFAQGDEAIVEQIRQARGKNAVRKALAALAKRRSKSCTIAAFPARKLADLLADRAVSLCVVCLEDEWIVLKRQGDGWIMISASGTSPVEPAGFSGAQAYILAAREQRPRTDMPRNDRRGRRYVDIALAGLVINVCGLLLPLFSSLVYNKVIASGHLATLWALVLGMLLFAGVEITLRIARSFTVEQLAVHSDIRAERTLVTRLLDGETRQATGFGALLSRYRDLGSARDSLLGFYMSAAVDLPFVLLYLLALLVIAGPVILVPVAAGGLMLGAHKLFHAKAHAAEADSAKLSAERFTLLGEIVLGNEAWKLSGLRSLLEQRWHAAVDASALGKARARYWRGVAQAATSLCVTLSSVFVLTVGVYLVEDHRLNVGGLIACSLLSLRAMGLMASVVGMLAGWRQFREAQRALAAALPSRETHERLSLEQPAGELVVRQLGWSFDGHRPLFDGLDLHVAPGEKVALIGTAGSGKSTLLRCLAGIVVPASGAVLIDGIAAHAVRGEDRRRWLGYKRQEPAIFEGTLYDNLGGTLVERDRLRRVAAALGLGFDSPHGVLSLDRHLTSCGTNLSGGQRQLIELARALARKNAILLLDEPTSGLDATSEQHVVDALELFASEATVVVATHSARVISIADRVIVLDAGRIVQQVPAHRILTAANSAGVPRASVGGRPS